MRGVLFWLIATTLALNSPCLAKDTGPTRSDPVKYVVVHAIGGPDCRDGKLFWSPAPGTAQRWKEFFDNHETLGIHYVIDRSGIVAASIPEERVATHAFGSYRGDNINATAVGIELVNNGDGKDPYPTNQISALVSLLRDLLTRHQLDANAVLRHSDIDNREFECEGSKHKMKVDPGVRLPFDDIKRELVGAQASIVWNLIEQYPKDIPLATRQNLAKVLREDLRPSEQGNLLSAASLSKHSFVGQLMNTDEELLDGIIVSVENLPITSDQIPADISSLVVEREHHFARVAGSLTQMIPSPVLSQVSRAAQSAFADGLTKLVTKGLTPSDVETFVSLSGDEGDFLEQAQKYLAPLISEPGFQQLSTVDQTNVVNTLRQTVENALQERGSLDRLGSLAGKETGAALGNVAGAIKLIEMASEQQKSIVDTVRSLQDSIQVDGSALRDRLSTLAKPDAVNAVLQNQSAALETMQQAVALLGVLETGINAGAGAAVSLPKGLEDLQKTADQLFKNQLDVKKAIASYAEDLPNTAMQLAALAQELGMDPKLVETVQEGVNLAQSAVNLGTSIATGNYVAAVGTLVGFLGGGNAGIGGNTGADPAIMGEFSKVNQKLDQLLEGQKQIRQDIFALRKDLSALAQQVGENHLETMAALRSVQESLLFNRKLIVDLAWKELGSCNEFAAAVDRSESYADQKADFDTNYNDYEACLNFVTQIVNWDYSFFELEAFEGHVKFADQNASAQEREKADRGIQNARKMYANLLSATRREFLQSPEIDFVTYLTIPSLTVDHLLSKVEALKSDRVANPVSAAQVQSLYNYESVVQYVDAVLVLHPWGLERDPGNPETLMPAARLRVPETYRTLEFKAARDDAVRRLRGALQLVDLSLAQHALLVGDLMVPYMAAKLADNSITSEMTEAVMSSAALRQNLALVWTLKQLTAGGFTLTAYNTAMFLQTKEQLAAMLCPKNACTIETDKNGVRVQFQGVSFAPPTARQVSEGRLQVTPEWLALYSTKRRVVDALAGYEIGNVWKEDQSSSSLVAEILTTQ